MLIFVHGRGQEGKDPGALKGLWIRAWEEGLSKSGLRLPLSSDEISFPYYGDALSPASGPSNGRSRWFRPLNWTWVRGVLQFVDKYLSIGLSVRIFTEDVHNYLVDSDSVDQIVSASIPRDRTCVVVSHSLGTVVATSVLSKYPDLDIALHVTAGSPLAVKAIKKRMRPISYPRCVRRWLNVLDPNDVVALHPLTRENYPVGRWIENKVDIDNQTYNEHGIEGYLRDPVVARRIYTAVLGEN